MNSKFRNKTLFVCVLGRGATNIENKSIQSPITLLAPYSGRVIFLLQIKYAFSAQFSFFNYQEMYHFGSNWYTASVKSKKNSSSPPLPTVSRHTSGIYLPLELGAMYLMWNGAHKGPHRGWSFIICKGGPAIFLGGHFQNLDLFWRGSFSVGSVMYLASDFNEFHESLVQSSNKYEQKFSFNSH